MKSNKIKCPHCLSNETVKNGKYGDYQTFRCKKCSKYFNNKKSKHSSAKKQKALFYYLNGVGIRKTALFLNISPALVHYWIKKANIILEKMLADRSKVKPNTDPDIIEFDEIYTHIKKKSETESLFGLLILEDRSVLLRL